MGISDLIFEIVSVRNTVDISVVRELFGEYQEAIGVNLEFQGFAAELAKLPFPYEPPGGGLFIARTGNNIAGCVAFRCLEGSTAEMKRLFVRPGFRGSGLGQRLIETVVMASGKAGYSELRLDTLPSMASALALYQKLGFVEIPPYGKTFLPGTRFYARALRA